MPNFSKTSLSRLATCDPALEAVARVAIQYMDFTVTCGHRAKEEQDKAYAEGRSKLKWPNGKHNKTPSLAMDLAPWPIDWDDEGRFRALAKVVKAAADEVGVSISWGGDWKSFIDTPHYELAAPSGWTRDKDGKPVPPKSATAEQSSVADAPDRKGQPLEILIQAMAVKYALPPALIRAMIHVESSGKANATRYEPRFFERYVDGKGFSAKEGKGRATSWGLMQIMGEVARELGFKGEFEELFEPAVNLEWCCRLLGKLKTRLYDSFGWPAVCSAYNGGLGAVKGKDNFTNPQYVAKVSKALGGVWPE